MREDLNQTEGENANEREIEDGERGTEEGEQRT